jgi:hypothetical protein
VFHTNAKGSHLLETRARFRAREGIEEYANAFLCPDASALLYYGSPIERYRGRVERGMVFGRKRAALTWRMLKQRFL